MEIKGHLDLFSGIGGFSLGLERAGIHPEWIGYSDIDKHANQVFKRRFNNAEDMGDIKNINTGELPEIDLVTFGFPCQDLSVANIRNRKGLKGKRSSLFFEVTEEKTLKSYSKSLLTLGMTVNGNYLIVCTKVVSPKAGSGVTLSDIVEENPDPKYFLSDDMTKKLLKRVKK